MTQMCCRDAPCSSLKVRKHGCLVQTCVTATQSEYGFFSENELIVNHITSGNHHTSVVSTVVTPGIKTTLKINVTGINKLLHVYVFLWGEVPLVCVRKPPPRRQLPRSSVEKCYAGRCRQLLLHSDRRLYPGEQPFRRDWGTNRAPPAACGGQGLEDTEHHLRQVTQRLRESLYRSLIWSNIKSSTARLKLCCSTMSYL